MECPGQNQKPELADASGHTLGLQLHAQEEEPQEPERGEQQAARTATPPTPGGMLWRVVETK